MASGPIRDRTYFRRTAVADLMGGHESSDSDLIVDCPYCNHAWKADSRWISGLCPNCGQMVYRYMDPKHD